MSATWTFRDLSQYRQVKTTRGESLFLHRPFRVPMDKIEVAFPYALLLIVHTGIYSNRRPSARLRDLHLSDLVRPDGKNCD